MESLILQLFSEGDFLLKEARSNFFIHEDNQRDAISKTCTAIKKYLGAYEIFLFENMKTTDNYHLLLHVINQKDRDFKRYIGNIYEVKCLFDESKSNAEGFFLYPGEINVILKNVNEVRDYIAIKIKMKDLFLANHNENSFMAT